ncbi:MAG: hypothetical protein K9K81_07845, partial [Desulfobacteraceae bacterium]|nr:hypothetical protein [Desulfobacteraceae bacterium]
ATLSVYGNLRKRSGAKKLTPAAGLSSCKNSGRGKKLFTVPSTFDIRICFGFRISIFGFWLNRVFVQPLNSRSC